MRCNRRPDPSSRRCVSRRAQNTAFTLVELLVCLAVVALLTGIMLPALRHVREASLRLRCASNMHQIGIAIATYTHMHNERMPSIAFADPAHREPQELMAASLGRVNDTSALPPMAGWEGLGRLVQGDYLGQCDCLYCPSHHGDHQQERYAEAYRRPPTTLRIYTNYHYAGHISHTGRRLDLTAGHDMLLLTDGLRTQSDFNHVIGSNRLFGDLSTDWWYDAANGVRNALPTSALPPEAQAAFFDNAWLEITKPVK